MTPELFLRNAIVPALALLPQKMNSPEAKAMMLAIAFQESGLKYRRQVGGPARGYFQFEQGGGVRGVLNHPATSQTIQAFLAQMDYGWTPVSNAEACYSAIEHNDMLAAAFARLLLWTLPEAMPGKESPAVGWERYYSGWRPGRPHRITWDAHFARAWEIVDA